ncbi:hypothetical protein [Achromobacter sp. UMC46]|uniref:hypothetical protein n=1 Tax=Achromobacter sp. UMC46 TaxID=1862319 RepID=UPI0016029F38|nr:hypothetical protein [Achromobacter sp. UMC46]MBB1592646.1 hypothetical protein [Achromobacter sp. UMC46]
MTATPPDPLATQHDSNTDLDDQAPVDAQTLRLREENRALRELLAAQVHATLPPPAPEPGGVRRLCWWLISAPGAALVGWRRLLGRDDAPRITGRRVGSATLTVLYTLAIYGALVLLVVSWNAPNNGITGATAASPVRVPLRPPTTVPTQESPSDWEADALAPPAPIVPVAPSKSVVEPPASRPETPAPLPPSNAGDTTPPASSGPHSTLRITEIPAQDPMAWVKALQAELAQCAALGFFDRPDCAWAARDQFCGPNHGWNVVKECPARP